MFLNHFYAIFLSILLSLNILGMEDSASDHSTKDSKYLQDFPPLPKSKSGLKSKSKQNSKQEDTVTGSKESDDSQNLSSELEESNESDLNDNLLEEEETSSPSFTKQEDNLSSKNSSPGWITLEPLSGPAEWEPYKKDYRVRTRDVFNNPLANKNDLIVIIVIHGTAILDFKKEAGPHNPNYFDKEHEEEENYKNFMGFAEWYAKKINKNCELVSYRWPGTNLSAVRKWAALFLSLYIAKNYSKDELGVLAHSHGCNVSNVVSQLIDRPITLLVYFDCPVREINPDKKKNKEWYEYFKKSPFKTIYEALDDIEDYTPKNFHTMLFFYSTQDYVAAAGSIKKLTAAVTVATPIIVYFAIDIAIDVAAPQVKALKLVKDHPIVAKYLGHAVRAAHYGITGKATSDSLQHLAEKAERSNVFYNQKNKKMVGIRVQINGKEPGHSEVPEIASVLTEIFTMLENNYPHHAVLNSYFDVNVNGDTVKEHKSSLVLTVRERGSAEALLKLTSDVRSQIDENTLAQELKFSEAQKVKFELEHKKAIDANKKNSTCNVM